MRKKGRSLIDKNSIETIISILQNSGSYFEISLTNYTTSIDYSETGQKYLKSFRSKKCFSAYKKIVNDVMQHEKPKVDSTDVRYFSHDITHEFYVEKAMQIDLKKAYATVLFNDRFISPKTYDYMNYISKTDRLAAVGMLASVKNMFTYNNGVIVDHEIIENPLRPFFYHCVKKVDEIMNVCRMEAVGNYIMTWVDAIYIQYNEKVVNEIRRILLYNGFECEISILEDFQCTFLKNKIQVKMMCEGKEKSFYIPNSNNVSANYLMSHIKGSNKQFKNDTENKNKL